jgi:DNA polymerase-4
MLGICSVIVGRQQQGKTVVGVRYLFADMNSFFASVEQQECPSLRGLPIAVVPMRVESTCCIAASYEAKGYGVKTGTSVREARQLCPHIRLIEARPQRYVAYHHRVIEAVESCLHVDHVCSIDEMYGKLLGAECQPERAAAIAYRVKDAIRRTVGACIRCSIGLAPNPWLAKIASDMNKPDGLTMLLPEQLPEAICHLALTDLPGIAKNMERRLAAVQITSVAQLCRACEADLSHAWGSTVLGNIWWQQLRGIDLPYRPTHRRTVGHSHVLPPKQRTDERAWAVLARMIHKAAARMRRIEYRAGYLTVQVAYLDRQHWEQRAALGLCRDTLTMVRAALPVWRKRPPGMLLKVGVVLTHLVAEGGATMPLFAGQSHMDGLADCMDQIDRKYGQNTLYLGAMWGAQASAPTRISFTQIPTIEEFNQAGSAVLEES